jgi:hypothetical protein
MSAAGHGKRKYLCSSVLICVLFLEEASHA